MILAVPRRALTLPLMSWYVSVMIVKFMGVGALLVGFFLESWSEENIRLTIAVLRAHWLFWLCVYGQFAWTLAWTVFLRVRDDHLSVFTVFKRSRLLLADCRVVVSRTRGRVPRRVYTVSVSDGRSTRQVASYSWPFDWVAKRARTRLERTLLSGTMAGRR